MKILFVINPNSGNKKKKKIISIIYKTFSVKDFKIIYWDNLQQDIISLIKDIISDFDTVVAVGGDGTVDVVAQALINTETQLAIIPSGSGNGLARCLGIPMEFKKAIKVLCSGKMISIDTCPVFIFGTP